MKAAEIKRLFERGQEWQVTNHYIAKIEHPCYGTTRRTILRVSGAGLTFAPIVKGEYPHVIRWPCAADLTIGTNGEIVWRGFPKPGILFLTFRTIKD